MQGWREVLDELLSSRRPALIAYAALLTGSRVDAEDLVHDAVVRAFARPRHFPNVHAAEGYLRRSIANRYLDRARSGRRFTAAMPRLASSAVVPERDRDACLDVRAALTTLSPRQRACVVLRFYEDLTVPDIAEVLGISLGTAKRYLSDGVAGVDAALGIRQDAPTDDHETVAIRIASGGN